MFNNKYRPEVCPEIVEYQGIRGGVFSIHRFQWPRIIRPQFGISRRIG